MTHRIKSNPFQGAYHELIPTNPIVQHVSFSCPGMNVAAFGGDRTWKEKLHFNKRKFNSKKSPDGQKQEF